MLNFQYKTGTESGSFSQREMDKFSRMMKVDTPAFDFGEEYTKFIQLHNGGEPLQRFFQVEGQWYDIERILNFADSSHSNIDLMFNVQQHWTMIEDRLSIGMFPFASLGGGNYLVFDWSDDQPAKVKMWYHELSTDDAPYLIPVASDFGTFLATLRTTPS